MRFRDRERETKGNREREKQTERGRETNINRDEEGQTESKRHTSRFKQDQEMSHLMCPADSLSAIISAIL